MSIRFWPFDSVDGDRSHGSAHPAAAFASLFQGGQGVVPSPSMDGLLVQPTSPASMDVEVALGSAFVRGRFLQVFGDPELVAIPPASSEARVDRVVLRLDLNERRLELDVLQGSSGSSEPPALTRDSEVWELSLAQVPVPGNASEVSSTTDERSDEDVCGFAFPGGAVPSWGGAFTAPVGGVPPTEAAHLATRGFVDDALEGVDTSDLMPKAGGTFTGTVQHGHQYVLDQWSRGEVANIRNRGSVSSGSITLTYGEGPLARIRNNGPFTLNLPPTSEVPAARSPLFPGAFIILAVEAGLAPGAITWDSRIAWGDDGAPVLSTTAQAVDLILFLSLNGGEKWIGTLCSTGHAVGSALGSTP